MEPPRTALVPLLLAELLLDRTLNRLWVFVPQNPYTHAAFAAMQWAGAAALLALYVYPFALMGTWGRRALPLAASAAVLAALDLAAGQGYPAPRLLPLLPLAAAIYRRSRAALAFSAYYAARGLADLYAGGLGRHAYLAEALWALLPLAGGWRPRPLAAAAAAALLAAVAASPYYVGMVLQFGMGISQPYLLPLAAYLALSARDRYPLAALLVGPQVQLSPHYLALAAAAGEATGRSPPRRP